MPTARELQAQRQQHVSTPATRLARLREQYGIPIGEAAQAVGVTKGYLSELENGKNGPQSPSVWIALRLARFYETTVEELFGKDRDDA